MSKGIIMFAHNNQEIDYFKIACINALLIRKNLNIKNISLITDIGTLEYAKNNLDENFINYCFENIIIDKSNEIYKIKNNRTYRDTSINQKSLPFYNNNHFVAYELSPYDETLFIDADYLVLSDRLNLCWNSQSNIMINKNIKEVYTERNTENLKIENYGIDLYWATVVYFKKTEESKHFFNLVEHITKNYQYYKDLYNLPKKLFRNDFAFSIAIHIYNSYGSLQMIDDLPNNTLLKVFDRDDIHNVEFNKIIFLLEKPIEKEQYTVCSVKDVDVHVMNKWSLTRNFDKFVELYYEK